MAKLAQERGDALGGQPPRGFHWLGAEARGAGQRLVLGGYWLGWASVLVNRFWRQRVVCVHRGRGWYMALALLTDRTVEVHVACEECGEQRLPVAHWTFICFGHPLARRGVIHFVRSSLF